MSMQFDDRKAEYARRADRIHIVLPNFEDLVQRLPSAITIYSSFKVSNKTGEFEQQ